MKNLNPMVYKYGEPVRIYNHYTDKKHRLKIKTLCDLFNDMAELHTYRQGVNADILNQQGAVRKLESGLRRAAGAPALQGQRLERGNRRLI